MRELRQHIQDELKKGRIEVLKSHTYEQICDLLDSQEKEMNDLERQLEEAREQEITFLNSLLWDMLPSDPRCKAINKRIEQLKEKGK